MRRHNTYTIAKVIFFFSLFSFLFSLPVFAELPSSTNYKIQSYGFGSGGTASSSSQTFNLFGIAGELESASSSSQNYNIGSGLTFLLKANIPAAPTFTNPSNNYDRLKFILNTSGNPTDTTYAIAISEDNFADDIRYIKSDNTIGTTLAASDWQSYANWGGASGEYVTGLDQGTTYYIKVKAKRGDFTESEYGPTASVATTNASLTFSIDSSTLTFSNLNSGNSYTDSAKTTVLETSTNAYNGYIVNARETAALTATGLGTIADYGSPNSAPTTWSGYGFGYTTNDSDLTGGTADRFTNGGAKYAGFTTSSPGDPVADHAGPVTSEISNEQFTISYRVSVSDTQKAGEYSTTVLYIVVPSY